MRCFSRTGDESKSDVICNSYKLADDRYTKVCEKILTKRIGRRNTEMQEADNEASLHLCVPPTDIVR